MYTSQTVILTDYRVNKVKQVMYGTLLSTFCFVGCIATLLIYKTEQICSEDDYQEQDIAKLRENIFYGLFTISQIVPCLIIPYIFYDDNYSDQQQLIRFDAHFESINSQRPADEFVNQMYRNI
ncbi:hypothetical protein pb186bvf_016794 [Paramecium bursaria]